MRRRESKVIDCVMRDGERMRIDFADLKMLPRLNCHRAVTQSIGSSPALIVGDLQTFTDIGIASFRRDEDRTIEIFHEDPQAAAVITMLVRDHNPIEGVWIFAEQS